MRHIGQELRRCVKYVAARWHARSASSVSRPPSLNGKVVLRQRVAGNSDGGKYLVVYDQGDGHLSSQTETADGRVVGYAPLDHHAVTVTH